MGNKKLLWAIIFSIILYLAAILYIGFDEILLVLSNFNLYYLPVILIFLIAGLLVEFSRWHYYLNILNIKISLKHSFLIFFAGLSVHFMPAKSGEFLRSYLLKNLNKIPPPKSLPIPFVSNILVFLFAAILSLPLILSFNMGWSLVIMLTLLIVFVAIIKNKKFVFLIAKLPILNKYTKEFTPFYHSTNKLITPKVLIISSLITLLSSLLTYSIFYLVLRALGVEINLIHALSIYAFSLIVGALSMLPGGIGAIEGTIFALLLIFGVSSSIATVATLLVRLFNLWFVTLLGLLFLGISNKKL